MKLTIRPLIILNNELFDAFPIQKYIFKNGKWHEVLIDSDSSSGFKYTISQPENINVKTYLEPEKTFKNIVVSEGDTYEYSPERILQY